MTQLSDEEVAPCPLCERVELVERLEWPQAPEIRYYQCAACGHVWALGQETPPLQVLTPNRLSDPAVAIAMEGPGRPDVCSAVIETS